MSLSRFWLLHAVLILVPADREGAKYQNSAVQFNTICAIATHELSNNVHFFLLIFRCGFGHFPVINGQR